jgi:preprotein translocase subunit SecY
MKLVEDAKDWPKWWSVRLSLIGGALLTFLEAFPHAVADIVRTLPTQVTGTVDETILRAIGIVCILASPIARVLKQRTTDEGR